MDVGGVEAFCSRPSVWRPMKSGPSVLCCRGLHGYNFLVRMEVLSQLWGGGVDGVDQAKIALVL